VFFGFGIKGTNDGDSGIRFHNVSSKHLDGRSDHVLEAMMLRGGGLRLKEKP
jgi:hypothetical protein